MAMLTTVDVTIGGNAFVSGATLGFAGGDGPAPVVSNLVVIDSYTITARLRIKQRGPNRNRFWDVNVTNPDGSSAVLVGGLTVTP